MFSYSNSHTVTRRAKATLASVCGTKDCVRMNGHETSPCSTDGVFHQQEKASPLLERVHPLLRTNCISRPLPS